MRVTGHRLSRGLQAGIGIGHEVAGRVIQQAGTAVQQYRNSRLLQRMELQTLERYSPAQHRFVGRLFTRNTDDVGRAIADGGPIWGRIHNLDIDGIDHQRLASTLGRYRNEIDGAELGPIVEDLESLADAEADGLGDLAESRR